jgi:tRNA(Ile)-lysidine synthase
LTTMKSELSEARAFLHRQFPTGGRVLCAVSGGLDSMCLLHFMMGQPGFSVAAAHFNHQLRGDAADRDQHFVEDWCAARHIPCFTGSGDTRALMAAEGLSAEEAARKLRYAFLEKTAAEAGFDAILTAHHADDNAETMLLNLIRGTGSAGLAGIPPVRGKICRPFLRLSREALAEYARAHGLDYVEDETNGEDIAARNVLRHQVLPVLRQLNPRAVEHMSFTAGVVERESKAIETLAAAVMERSVRTDGQIAIPCPALLEALPPVAERAVLGLLSAAAGARRDLGSAHVEAVLALVKQGREGAQLSLPYGLTARIQNAALVIALPQPRPEQTILRVGYSSHWGYYTLTLHTKPEGEGLALSLPEEDTPLRVGPCPPAGRLELPGSRGSRSIKRLCLDRRISLAERDNLPAIYAGKKLAAVWPLGTDRAFEPGKKKRDFFIQIIHNTEEKRYEQ